jgi:hypothetical protein
MEQHSPQNTSEHGRLSFLGKSSLSWPEGLLIIIFLALAIYNAFLCDDAFITFRFADNLASGNGPVYNPGERVEGYTNFLWMLLMAIVIKMGGAPQLWSRILSIGFSLGTILLFLKSGNKQNKPPLGELVFAACLIFSAPFSAWSTGGLETGAYTFFLFGGIVTFISAYQANSHKKLLFASLMFTLAALTRPEGVLVFVLAFGYLAVAALSRKVSFGQIILFLLPFAILYGIYFVWRLEYYGKLFPNTFYIKEPGPILIKLGFQYCWRFLVNCPIWLPVALAAYVWVKSRSPKLGRGYSFIILLFLIYSTYVIYAGGDFMDLSRFLMPMLPPLFLLLGRLYNSGADNTHGRTTMILSAIMVAGFAFFNIQTCIKTREISYEYDVDSMGALRRFVSEWTSVGHLISEYSLPTDTIAVTAAGIIPYYSKLYTIDMYGLEAVDLSKYGQLKRLTRPGHRMTISLPYLRKLQPHFLIAHPIVTEGRPRQFPHSRIEDMYPVLLEKYAAVSAELPGLPGYFLSFWVRKDVVPRIPKNITIYKTDYSNP